MKNLDFELIYNGRDIGQLKTKDGRNIKKGKLFRSGCLSPVSEKDIQILNSLHLTDVIDFRESNAFIDKPDYRLDGVNYHNFPPFEFVASKPKKEGIDDDLMNKVKAVGGGFVFMKNLYKNIFNSEMALTSYTNFFKTLTQKEDSVILWHCAQGKDRAGLAAFLLEYALGVSYDDCVKDYLHSAIEMDRYQQSVLPLIKAHYKDDNEAVQSFIDAYTVKIEYLEEAIKFINEKYDSIDNFLVSVLKVDIDKLRKIYLE